MSSAKRRIPDAVLEFYLASLLDEPMRARVEASLAQSAPDRARLEELHAHSETLLREHPAASMAARVERILEQRKRRRRWWTLGLPALSGAFVAALLWVHAPTPREEPGAPMPSGDFYERPARRKPKGGESLSFEIRHALEQVELQPGELFTPREPLEVEVWSARAGYVAVLVRERNGGGVRARYPALEVNAAPGTPGVIALVPFTVKGVSEVFVLFSERPFSLSPVLRAVEEGRQVETGVPMGVDVFVRVLRPRGEP